MTSAAQQDSTRDTLASDGQPPLGQEANQPQHDPPPTAHELQSTEQAQLLDAISGLQHADINAEIDLPQIVVCGDQSSGKSSVLEAIARVPFPIASRTTTRFATEVSLRHAERPGPITATISPAGDRSEEKRAEILRFHREVSSREDLGEVIKDAHAHLQGVDPGNTFWSDQLRIEISGPDQPHLTLVDLPGIIHSENNAVTGDIGKIKNLVEGYLQHSRAIILAVVNSLVDEDGQEIFKLLRDADASSEQRTGIATKPSSRTIGVLTRPDQLTSGSDQQRHVISLVQNQRIPLGLGWHILRNLEHERSDRSPAERDAIERELFNSEPWIRLNRGNVGIERLRSKLKDGLFDAILTGLPILKRQMGQKLEECRATLDRLGPARESIDAQRKYLSEILTKLQRLLEAALKSDYSNTEFANFCARTSRKALRDSVNNLTDEFDRNMRKHGRQYHVFTEDLLRGDVRLVSTFDQLPENQSPNFFPPYTLGGGNPQNTVTNTLNVAMKTYCQALSDYSDRTRGENLRGDPAPHTVDAVFRQQSVPWTRFAENFGDMCHAVTYDFLSAALRHVAGEHVAEALQREFVRQHRANKYNMLQERIKELLWPFKEMRPKTYNPRYMQEINQPTAITEEDDNAIHTFAQLAQVNKFDAHLVAAAKLMDKADIIYEIALDRFVDEMATLGIERCLLHDLPNMFSVAEQSFGDSQVRRIASETQEVRDMRSKTQRQVTALKTALDTFRMYSDHTSDAWIPHSTTNTVARSVRPAAAQTPINSNTSSSTSGITPPENDTQHRATAQGASATIPSASSTAQGGRANLAPPIFSLARPVSQHLGETTPTAGNNSTRARGTSGSNADITFGSNDTNQFTYRRSSPTPGSSSVPPPAPQAGGGFLFGAGSASRGATPSGVRIASNPGTVFTGTGLFGSATNTASPQRPQSTTSNTGSTHAGPSLFSGASSAAPPQGQ